MRCWSLLFTYSHRFLSSFYLKMPVWSCLSAFLQTSEIRNLNLAWHVGFDWHYSRELDYLLAMFAVCCFQLCFSSTIGWHAWTLTVRKSTRFTPSHHQPVRETVHIGIGRPALGLKDRWSTGLWGRRCRAESRKSIRNYQPGSHLSNLYF